MLFDPNWGVQAIYSLDSLIGWLEKQPPERVYDFHQWDNCVLAQWLRSIDPFAKCTPMAIRTNYIQESGYNYTVLGKPVNVSHFKPIAYGSPTFGAALERARQAQTAGEGR